MGYEYQLSGKGVGILRRYKRRVNLRNCEIFHRNFVMLETSKIDYQRSYNKPPPSRIGPPPYPLSRGVGGSVYRFPGSGFGFKKFITGIGFRLPGSGLQPETDRRWGWGSYLPFHFLYKMCIKNIFHISPDPVI